MATRVDEKKKQYIDETKNFQEFYLQTASMKYKSVYSIHAQREDEKKRKHTQITTITSNLARRSMVRSQRQEEVKREINSSILKLYIISFGFYCYGRIAENKRQTITNAGMM